MKGEEIQKKIIRYLGAKKWPATTEEIAKGVGISWNTAELHLTKLQTAGKVGFRRAGRQNQWWLENIEKTIPESLEDIRKNPISGNNL